MIAPLTNDFLDIGASEYTRHGHKFVPPKYDIFMLIHTYFEAQTLMTAI